MKPAEILTSRIDSLNEALNPAVRRTGGAEFALMLSMIAESQALAQRLQRAEADDGPAAVATRDQLYDERLVGMMSGGLARQQLGDLHMAVSWVETVPLSGRRSASAEQPLLGAALGVKAYSLLDEIQESRARVAA
ncbi:hypothetical protein [Motiliproteus sp. SC1-56]|uniref:hypothetical protein n=1 Tax=Motiliproteus sp. SC1-56 TaxID=2799565 RepID=UPI001A8D6574|nr:hypothetical protein [Motiliproteus sp. SC1-56]